MSQPTTDASLVPGTDRFRGTAAPTGSRYRGAVLPAAVAAAVGSVVLAPTGSAAAADVPAVRAAPAVQTSALQPPALQTPALQTRTMQAAPAVRTAAVRTHAQPSEVTYRVRTGDTVSHIALRSGASIAGIVAANGLDSRATIRVGQRIRIPSAGGETSRAASGSQPTYTVRAGDTVSHIALRSGASIAAIVAANGLDSRATIRVGQRLRLPGGAARVPSTFAGRAYPSGTVRAAQGNADALATRDVPSRARMQQIIADTARAHGVDPAMAQAISFQESGFNMRAVSPANAVGAMQVIPSSGDWASDLAGRRLDLFDPGDNALAGVLILRALARLESDPTRMVAGYYQGLGSVRRHGLYPDTRRYVANVQTLAARFR